jgi:putative protease
VEEKIGVVTDYLDRIGVAVIQLPAGDLHVGDQVHITGRTTEHTQWVESLQIEHEAVAEAPRGRVVAMRTGLLFTVGTRSFGSTLDDERAPLVAD